MKNAQLTKIPTGGGQRSALLGKLTDFRRGSLSITV